jgi:hypothetical protein
MENDERELIPPPSVVREELARNYEQARLLRRQLRISEDAAIAAANRRPCPKVTRFQKRVGRDNP